MICDNRYCNGSTAFMEGEEFHLRSQLLMYGINFGMRRLFLGSAVRGNMRCFFRLADTNVSEKPTGMTWEQWLLKVLTWI
ncbi:hypothetical protein SK128_014354 [Halocaridina rubra]|uniref:Uncharacterized protein n=1 Tax=Halocaridina rubra TaxID=373956 RepID=A0AAN8WX96_HALRR